MGYENKVKYNTEMASASLDHMIQFFEGKTLIWCPEKYMSDIVTDALRQMEYTWQTGELITETDWGFFEGDTCYGMDSYGLYICSCEMVNRNRDNYNIVILGDK